MLGVRLPSHATVVYEVAIPAGDVQRGEILHVDVPEPVQEPREKGQGLLDNLWWWWPYGHVSPPDPARGGRCTKTTR